MKITRAHTEKRCSGIEGSEGERQRKAREQSRLMGVRLVGSVSLAGLQEGPLLCVSVSSSSMSVIVQLRTNNPTRLATPGSRARSPKHGCAPVWEVRRDTDKNTRLWALFPTEVEAAALGGSFCQRSLGFFENKTRIRARLAGERIPISPTLNLCKKNNTTITAQGFVFVWLFLDHIWVPKSLLVGLESP